MKKYAYGFLMLACGLLCFVAMLGTAIGKMGFVWGSVSTVLFALMGYGYSVALEAIEAGEAWA